MTGLGVRRLTASLIRRLDPTRAVVWAVLLTIAIGSLDYVTGVRLRLFPLYFLPVALIAVGRSWRGALLGALMGTTAWAVTNFGADPLWTYVINVASQGVAFFLVSSMVYGLHQQVRYQETLALTDPLTRLSNARAFQNSARQQLQRRQGGPLTLAYLDLDNFKRVNDTLGHSGADVLLTDIGEALRRAVRATDVVARIGGDEFAILLPETSMTSARIVLERVQAEVRVAAKPIALDITFSIGAVTFSGKVADVDTLIGRADALMYEVKAGGKNGIHLRTFEPEAHAA